MGPDEDDWETADFHKSDGPLNNKAQDTRNLRPSAPTFSPRSAAGPDAASSESTLWDPPFSAKDTARLVDRADALHKKTSFQLSRGAAPKTSSPHSPRSRLAEDEEDPWARPAPAAITNRQIWQAANTPQPYIPPVATSAGPVAPAAGGMRILRRPSPSSVPSSGASTPLNGAGPKSKTLEEREEEYKRARERIFAKDQAMIVERDGTSKAQPVEAALGTKVGRPGSNAGASGSGSGSQRGRERDQVKPRDEIDEVIRAAEEMALTGETQCRANPHAPQPIDNSSASSIRGGRGRGRGKPRKISLQDDFETRSDMAMRSAAVGTGVGAATAYGYMGVYVDGQPSSTANNYPDSRTGSSGRASPVRPLLASGAARFDPFGAASGWDNEATPLRPAGEVGIVRQPRGPGEGGSVGFGTRVRPPS